MNVKKSSNRSIQIILIIIFIVLAVALFFLLDSRKNHNQHQHLQRITERFELAYKTIYAQHKILAASLHSGIMGRFAIEDFYGKVVTADETQKDILRKKLLAQVMPRYKKLRQTVQLRQLHFHLSTNESFLRLHRPEKFGDDLTSIRKTVEYVNREHSPIDGFEEGKIFNGYRFVFPITTSEKTHLGSMEVSFGPDAFTSAMMKQYLVLSNFFIKETIVHKVVFPEELERTYKKSHHPGYYFDKNVLAELKKVSRREMKKLQPHKSVTDEIYANANSCQTMSLYDSSIDMVFTTIPVVNPLTQKMVAFLTVRSQSPVFKNLTQQFKTVFALCLFLMAMTLSTFYLQYSKRRTLESTMTLLQQERDMFMQGPVMTFTWQNSENWPVTQVSQNVHDILGVSQEKLLDGSVLYASLIHPDDQQRVMDEVIDNSGPECSSFTHKPYRLLNHAGESVWILDSTTLIRNHQGEISHYSGYLVDITSSVLMEEEILEAKNRLELVIEGARLGTWDWNIKTGDVIFNKRWAEIIGHTLDEIEPNISTWENIIHPDEEEEITRVLTDHLEGRTSAYMTEHRLRHKSGKWVWVLDVGKVFERDDEGTPIRAVGIHLDITGQREAEAKIKANALFLNSILQSSSATAIIATDGNFSVQYFNPFAEKIFGMDKDTVIGKTIWELHGADGPIQPNMERFKQVIKQVKETGSHQFSLKAGPVFLDIQISTINDNDAQFAGFLLLAIDVTKQKKAEQEIVQAKEEAETANHAKSVFLSNMSHELRTPLNAILGYTQIFAKDSSLSSQQQSGIKTIHQSGEHLLMLINDILDLSKIEASKMELVKAEFRLPEFLLGIADIIKVRAQQTGLKFSYEANNNLPVSIKADELRLRQVILNLLSNGFKFTKHGRCSLRVKSTLLDEKTSRLTVIVEDTGPGIERRMQEKIFEPFQQSGERLKYSEGSGLGLAISRKMVKLMGGNLQLESPINNDPVKGEGPGCRFSFSIDVRIGVDTPTTAKEEKTVTSYRGSSEDGQHKKILIVDDKISNRAVLRDTLAPLGFVCHEVEDGSEVLPACEEEQPDVILMDLCMPKVDGFTATEQLKSYEKFADIPVIAITASTADSQQLKKLCLERGFSDYIKKPYSIAELLEALAENLKIELQYAEELSGETVTEDDFDIPPADVLEQLQELLAMGNLDGVVALTEKMAMESEKYQDFARRVMHLAEEFQLSALETLFS